MNDQSTEIILKKSSQFFLNDIPAMITVLIFPVFMVTFANSSTGVFFGSIFLIFFIYGILFMYNKLYRKQLTVTDKKIIFENKEWTKTQTTIITFEEVESLLIKKNLINNLTGTGKIILKTKNGQFDMVNVKEPQSLKDVIEKAVQKNL